MKRAERAAKTLDALRELGTTIAIDDFGTGYSSLSYLKRFAVDRLKIDRTFVRDIPRNANDTALAKSIIALGHSLNLSIVAEGVETQAQRELLASFGCDEVQGFLFSAPRTAEALAVKVSSVRMASTDVVPSAFRIRRISQPDNDHADEIPAPDARHR